METPPPAEGTAPAAEPATPAETPPPAAPAAPTPPPEPLAAPAANLDPMDAALAAMEQQKAEKDKPAEPAAEAPKAPETPTPEPNPEPAKVEGEQPPAEPKVEKVLPNRVSTAQFSDTEQQAIALGKALKDAGETVPSLKERIEIVEARQKAAPPVAEPEPQHDNELAELDAKLAEAKAKRKEISTKIGTEELDAAQDEIEALRQQKSAVESQKAQASAKQRDAFSTARTASIKSAKDQFPSSKDPNSELAQAFAARHEEIKSDRARSALLKDPKAPEVIVAEVALELAKLRAADNGTTIAAELANLMESPAPAKAAAPAAVAPAPVVRKPTTAGGAASTPPATPPPPKVPTLAEASSMSAAELEKAFPSPKHNTGYVLHR